MLKVETIFDIFIQTLT